MNSAEDKALREATACQPLLHNLKGAGSRALNELERVLPYEEAVQLMRIVGKIAKRYSRRQIS